MAATIPDSSILLALLARPPRVALFVPIPDELGWERVFEHVLAGQMSVWGGSHNLPFPLEEGLEDNPLFWALIDRLDPDYLCTVSLTGNDIAEIAPDVADDNIARDLAAYAEGLDTDDVSPEAYMAEVKATLLESVWVTASPETLPTATISQRVATLEGFDGTRTVYPVVASPPIGDTGEVEMPLTGVGEIAEWPDALVNVMFDGNPLERLMLTASIGRRTASLTDYISRQRPEMVWRDVRCEIPSSWAQDVTAPAKAGHNSWSLTESGLACYRRHRREARVVAGGSIWDFLLFLALRRWCRRPTLWIPTEKLSDQTYMRAVERVLAREAQGLSIQVTSASGETESQLAAQAIRAFRRMPDARAQVVPWKDVLPDVPDRLFLRDAPANEHPVALHHDATVPLPSPLVSVGDPNAAFHPKWMIDVESNVWQPLRNKALGQRLFVSGRAEPDLFRTTRDGVAYTSNRALQFGGQSVAMSVHRPRLKPLSLLGQLEAIASAHGWSIEQSDKGAYAARTAELVGGFRALASLLRQPWMRGLLDEFQRGSSYVESESRVVLTRREITSIVRRSGGDIEAVDQLISSGLITRGFFVKCSDCRNSSWYSLEEIDTLFRCHRCLARQPFDEKRWRGGGEPVWHYRLAAVAHSFLDHGGHIPVLAADTHFSYPELPPDDVEAVFEMEFYSPDGTKSESDMVVRRGHELWIGEATRSDTFEGTNKAEHDRFERLRLVAETFSATGILSASSTQLREKTRRRVDGLLGGCPYRQLVVINDLLVEPEMPPSRQPSRNSWSVKSVTLPAPSGVRSAALPTRITWPRSSDPARRGGAPTDPQETDASNGLSERR